jgi:hypothetical protein
VADTWDEAAWRARLAAADQPHDVVACRELDRHAAADLEAALAVLDAARAEIDRLRAKLDEADGVIAAATSAITEQLNRAVALRCECDRLRAALGPFAALARGHDSDSEYSPVVVDHRRGEVLKLFGPDRDSAATLRDCRRAAAALEGDSDG